MLKGVTGVHHVSMSVPNLQKAKEFYVDILGFEIVAKMGWEQGSDAIDDIVGLKNSAANLLMLRAGNAHLELFEYTSPEPKPGDPMRPACDHGYTHFCLDVVGIYEVYQRLVDAGMEFNTPPQGQVAETGIVATYGRDPFGNLIEIQELRDDHDMNLNKAGRVI
jgi:catechol 2,3-dioxygenase-like lactoylglutathione lyase family enzyme